MRQRLFSCPLVMAGLALAPAGLRAGDCNPCPQSAAAVQCPPAKVVVEMAPPEIVFRQAPAQAPCAEHFCLFKRHSPAPVQTVQTYSVAQPAMSVVAAAPAAQAFVPVQSLAVMPAQAVSYAAPQAVAPVAVQAMAAPPMIPAAQAFAIAPPVQAVPSFAVAPAAQPVQPLAYISPQAVNVAQAVPQAIDVRAAAAYLTAMKDALAAAQAEAARKADASAQAAKNGEASAQAADADCCKQIEDLKARIAKLEAVVLHHHATLVKNKLIPE